MRRRRNIVDDRIHQRKDGIPFAVFQIGSRPAVASACVKHGEIKLFFRCIKIDEEFINGIQNLFRSGIRTVDFIDHDDRFELEFESLVEHETGLGKRSFRRIDEENDSVRHIEHPFHLSAEIAVSRSVDDIDFYAAVVDADVFCKDRDPAFPFEIVAVEEAFVHFLIFAEQLCLFDDLIDKRGLPVVDMRNNRDISDVLHKVPILKSCYF